MNKTIKYIIGLIVILAILGGLGYYIYTQFISQGGEIKEGSELEVISKETPEEKANAVLVKTEIQKKVQFLNQILKTNYLKITDYKQQANLGNYTDPGFEFYQFKIDYDYNESAIADYDVKIDKGSLNEEDFKKKSKLYKTQVKNKMKRFYKVYGYDRFKSIGIVGYIEKLEGNNYGLFHLGDYVYNKFGDKSLSPDTLGKLQILQDYLNYETIFFNKEPKEVYDIVSDLEKELDDKNFTKLSKIIKALFFYDIKEKKRTIRKEKIKNTESNTIE